MLFVMGCKESFSSIDTSLIFHMICILTGRAERGSLRCRAREVFDSCVVGKTGPWFMTRAGLGKDQRQKLEHMELIWEVILSYD